MTSMDGKQGHYYTVGADETIVDGITTAVGALEGKEPPDLPAIYDFVPTDSLESLFEKGNDDLQVSFQYAGYDIVVNGRGIITVVETQDRNRHSWGECAHCKTELRLNVDHPIITKQGEEGVSFFAFCDRECKEMWKSNHQPSSDTERTHG